MSTASRPRARSRRRLEAHEGVAEVVAARRWPSWASAAITAASSSARVRRSSASSLASSARAAPPSAEAAAQGGELTAGQEQVERPELGHEVAVAAGGVGLALERAQLAAHLAQQVAAGG